MAAGADGGLAEESKAAFERCESLVADLRQRDQEQVVRLADLENRVQERDVLIGALRVNERALQRSSPPDSGKWLQRLNRIRHAGRSRLVSAIGMNQNGSHTRDRHRYGRNRYVDALTNKEIK